MKKTTKAAGTRKLPATKDLSPKSAGAVKGGDDEKRGVDQDKTLWNWRKLIVNGSVPPR